MKHWPDDEEPVTLEAFRIYGDDEWEEIRKSIEEEIEKSIEEEIEKSIEEEIEKSIEEEIRKSIEEVTA